MPSVLLLGSPQAVSYGAAAGTSMTLALGAAIATSLGACAGSSAANADGEAEGVNRLVVIFGYSNDIGLMVTSAVTSYLGLTEPFPPVKQYDQIAFSAGNPPSFSTTSTHDMAPREGGHGVAYPDGSGGVELSMMRELVAARPADTWFVAKFCMDSSSMITNWGEPSFPTGGPPFLDQLTTFIQDRIAEYDIENVVENVIIVSMNGAVDLGTNYATYLAALDTVFGGIRAELGNVRIVMERLTTQIESTRHIIAAQEAFVAVDDGRSAWVRSDDLDLRSAVNKHFADDSYATLGVRLAAGVADNINGIIPDDPHYVAAGQVVVANSAQSIAVVLPPHKQDDIVCVLLSGSGNVNYALTSNPSGFVLKSTVHDSGSGVNARLQLWWARAPSDNGLTGPTIGDAASDGSKAAIPFVIRGATTSGDPFEDTQSSNETTVTTAVSMPSVTTSGANRLILNLCAAVVDQSSPQFDFAGPVNAALDDLNAEVNYNSSSGSGVALGLFVGRKATAAATGATTHTLLNPGRQARLSLAVRP